ncbi:CHAT domain-containing protein, partial [Microbispora sp. NPDC049125]|uniref:CHAT domain-containing protein n=1 Tax=Microbispora sp. NPDC049125 TaxID=3154929 RepID=UPI003467E48C
MTANDGERATRVLISHAHPGGTPPHEVWEFYRFLRDNGIDARVDLTEARPVDWAKWIEKQFASVDYVLVVGSPAYRERAEDYDEEGTAWGARHEAARIRRAFATNDGQARQKYLPVVLPGRTAADLPDFFGAPAATYFSVREFTPAGAEELLRVLLDIPRYEELPLGQAPVFTSLGNELVLDVRIEDGRIVTQARLSGSPLGENRAGLPFGIETAWGSLPTGARTKEALRAAVAERDMRLGAMGQALGAAVLSDVVSARVRELADGSTFDARFEIVIEASGPALALPYELMRLGDGRLLAALPGVSVRRRLAGLDRPATPASPGPLKILAAVAAPDEPKTTNVPLDVEAEMQAVLDSAGAAGKSRRAQLRILEVASPEEIGLALREDQYHVLHLSAHGSSSSVELAGESGEPITVSTEDLVALLRSGGQPLPLIVVSACAGASNPDALAYELVRHGADRVLAMQAPVTDRYATELARLFYLEMAEHGSPPGVALAHARRTLEERRRRATEGITWPEYGLATLVCASGDPVLVDRAADPVELSVMAQVGSGIGVHEIPVGRLIGRRKELRDILAVLRRTDKALAEVGRRSGAVVCGIGGIGKSALAGRAIARMRESGWATVVHIGRWSPPDLLAAVAPLLGDGELSTAFDEAEDTDKFDILLRFLRQARLLLVFDDFEQNLTSGGDAFIDPAFEKVFTDICRAAVVGAVLVTCRYPVPNARAKRLWHQRLPALTRAELRRLLQRLPKLRDLDDDAILVGRIGGHPRLLEFVDALLRGGWSTFAEVNDKLEAMADRVGLDLDGLEESADLGGRIDDAIVLGSQDILLNDLLGLLDETDRDLLLQAAATIIPMTIDDLALARYGASKANEHRGEVRATVRRLMELTLLSPSGEDEIAVHPWVTQAIDQGQEDAARRRRIISMRYARLADQRGGYDDRVDIARQLEALSEWEELTSFAMSGAEAIARGSGELAVAAYLAEITPSVPTNASDYLALVDRYHTALMITGNLTEVRVWVERLLAVAQERLEADPDNAEAQRDLSIALDRVGDVAVMAGDLSAARQAYQEGLDIAARLAQDDPDNAQAQRDLSIALDNVGHVAVMAGDLSAARQAYQDSRNITARLAHADPD